LKIERAADPANANGIGEPRGQGLNLSDLL
jgi:hypothetical protein